MITEFCPNCAKLSDGYLNVREGVFFNHFGVCDSCRSFWYIGANLFSSWQDETEDDWEGCLSIPELRGRTPRLTKLRVNALNRKGKRIEFVAEGFFARVVQHEFDHLNGRVYVDRMRDFSTLTHLDEFQRYWMPQDS